MCLPGIRADHEFRFLPGNDKSMTFPNDYTLLGELNRTRYSYPEVGSHSVIIRCSGADTSMMRNASFALIL